MKFEIELPQWAKWVAQDADRNWYAYEYKPTHGAEEWGRNRGDMAYLAKGYRPDDFTQELYEVNWDE